MGCDKQVKEQCVSKLKSIRLIISCCFMRFWWFEKLEDFQSKFRRFVRLWKSRVIIKQYIQAVVIRLVRFVQNGWRNTGKKKIVLDCWKRVWNWRRETQFICVIKKSGRVRNDGWVGPISSKSSLSTCQVISFLPFFENSFETKIQF